MAQPSVSSFFITRKRGIEDDAVASEKLASVPEKSGKVASVAAIRQGITSQRTRSSRRVQMQNVDGIETQKVAQFFFGGSLSPQKKARKQSEPPQAAPRKESSAREEEKQKNDGMKTPTKKTAASSTPTVEKTLLIPNNSLNADELKKKLRGSSKLTELKTSLNKLRNGFDKLDQMEKKHKTKASQAQSSPSLKPFKNIELQILSPKKTFSSPIKLKDSPMKNTLIGSPKILTPKKLLFSPTKASANVPAYERFQHLAETGTPTLQLPFKYRYILEVFKAVDTVCAMFFNRKEKITFKKMKPGVQRILRKNFFESHLAQINHLMPSAYKFAQEKTRNYGSTSKQDYYQLVITPNIKNETDDVSPLTLSPQILIERTRKMTEILIDRVYAEHEKFLQTLDVPMNVTRGALKRWHPDFPLESVSDVDQKQLPQPPNVERFSSAKDVLSTARNLFNCSTSMERALERLETKKRDEKAKQVQNQEQTEALTKAIPEEGNNVAAVDEKPKPPPTQESSSLLKGVPQSLLDKIRAKQAARALDTMTRRPSQELDAAKYARLPEIARHLRNVFVTEKKGVLPLESVLTKIENSYKGNVSQKEIEELLRLIAQEMPRWITFHDIRNTLFVKVNRETDLTDIISKLQKVASQKAQIQ